MTTDTMKGDLRETFKAGFTAGALAERRLSEMVDDTAIEIGSFYRLDYRETTFQASMRKDGEEYAIQGKVPDEELSFETALLCVEHLVVLLIGVED